MTSSFTPSDGHEIDGWYLNEEKFDFATQVNEDITLTATEKVKTFTVIFMVDGEKKEEKTVNWNEKVTAPNTNPTKGGHTFSGWYQNNEKFNFDTPITTDITLTAEFTLNKIKVIFDYGYDSKKEEKEINWGETLETTELNTEREGYDFDGWTLDGKSYDLKTAVTEDIMLTAAWKIRTFTVTFMVGEEKKEEKTVEWNKTVTKIEKERKTPLLPGHGYLQTKG